MPRTLKDDRGRPFTLIDEHALAHLGDPERRRKVRRAMDSMGGPMTPKERRRTTAMVVVCLPVLLGLALLPATMSFGLKMPLWLMLVLAIPLGFLPALLTMLIYRFALGERLARRMLDAGICPGCGYGREDLPAAADGCKICPECGGSWRDSPILRQSGEP